MLQKFKTEADLIDVNYTRETPTYMDKGCCVGLLYETPSSADSPPELL